MVETILSSNVMPWCMLIPYALLLFGTVFFFDRDEESKLGVICGFGSIGYALFFLGSIVTLSLYSTFGMMEAIIPIIVFGASIVVITWAGIRTYKMSSV
jgi:hypothetical protein